MSSQWSKWLRQARNECVQLPPFAPAHPADAATALRVMTLIKRVASRGTTVLCSLHQPRPRVLNLLDKVILLSKGRVAFFGNTGEAEPYFSSIGRPFPSGQPHPADAMLALCCREDGGDLPLLFRRASLGLSVNGGGLGSGRGRSPVEDGGKCEDHLVDSRFDAPATRVVGNLWQKSCEKHVTKKTHLLEHWYNK